MKKEIKSIHQMRDSSLLYDRNPPSFGYLFIIIISIFLLLAVIVAMKVPKIYMIKANGIVTNTNSNYVMCSNTGVIQDYCMYEGQIVKEGDVLFRVKSTDYNLQESQLLLNKEIYEKQIQKYELLSKSIVDNQNYFSISSSDDALYYNTYEKYKAQIEQNSVDVSTYKAYGYTDEQIENEIIKNERKLLEIYYTALQAAENARNEASLQLDAIKSQLAAVKNGQKEYEVKANQTGVFHSFQNFKNGMVVQTTTTIGTITPENSKRIIEAYVTTYDMARIHIGDEVQITIDGLAQNVYGTIGGKIESIDSNITVQQAQDGSSSHVFKIEISMDSDYLISNNGDKVNITNGMTAEAKIKYDKVTYMNYILEKLGFKTK